MTTDAFDDVHTVSRRRSALLVSEERRKSSETLSMADVAALKSDRSAAARAQIARRLGLSLDGLNVGNTRDLVQGILGLLVHDVEAEVRKALAETVAQSRALPPSVAEKLARDDIDIAIPVLEKSPVLTDDVLMDVVRTNALQYALAVAGRENISEGLSQTLVDHGDETVVVRLVGNLGAKLSERTLHQIVDDYAESKAVNDRLVQRPTLPSTVIENMVAVLTKRLTWDLMGRNEMDPNQASLIVDAVRARATEQLELRERSDHTRREQLAELHRNDVLEPELLLNYLKTGDIAGFEIGMSLLSGLGVDEVRRLAYEPDRRYLSGLCARAAFSTPHYITLRMALELAEATITMEVNHRGYSSDSIRYLQKQYDLLRTNDLAIDELIYGE